MRVGFHQFHTFSFSLFILTIHQFVAFSRIFFSYSDGPKKIADIFRNLYEKITSGEIEWPSDIGKTAKEVEKPSRKRNLETSKQPIVTYSCDKCEKVYNSNKNLLAHKRNAHSNIKMKYRCPQCESRYSLPYDLKYHLRDVHKKCMDIKEVVQFGVPIEGIVRFVGL